MRHHRLAHHRVKQCKQCYVDQHVGAEYHRSVHRGDKHYHVDQHDFKHCHLYQHDYVEYHRFEHDHVEYHRDHRVKHYHINQRDWVEYHSFCVPFAVLPALAPPRRSLASLPWRLRAIAWLLHCGGAVTGQWLKHLQTERCGDGDLPDDWLATLPGAADLWDPCQLVCIDELVSLVVRACDVDTDRIYASRGRGVTVHVRAHRMPDGKRGGARCSLPPPRAGVAGPPMDPAAAEGRCWRVVGGRDLGGIIARQGKELGSDRLGERLAVGALLRQERLEDGRLCFRKLSGEGPDRGWVSIRANGKELVVPERAAAPPLPAARCPAPQCARPRPRECRERAAHPGLDIRLGATSPVAVHFGSALVPGLVPPPRNSDESSVRKANTVTDAPFFSSSKGPHQDIGCRKPRPTEWMSVRSLCKEKRNMAPGLKLRSCKEGRVHPRPAYRSNAVFQWARDLRKQVYLAKPTVSIKGYEGLLEWESPPRRRLVLQISGDTNAAARKVQKVRINVIGSVICWAHTAPVLHRRSMGLRKNCEGSCTFHKRVRCDAGGVAILISGLSREEANRAELEGRMLCVVTGSIFVLARAR
ncbi:unnamed protein product [Prorocentrum cordatum]|uniref:Uncharacterized protein n=1 Tax=Prorocentrum cordatum TaxID=2364126 RepID=A0ABN9VS43_9DINO|nr:unnamed protein product [Polarella glacialis]